MRDYIIEVANALQNGSNVIFYTVGSGTFEYIRELKKRFGLLPSAICDADIKKQGRTYKGLENIIVISPQNALMRFPDGMFFITSLDYRYQIIGYLLDECGVEKERIINYVPVKKIRSCSFLQKALIYNQTGDMQFCWRNPCPLVPSDSELHTERLLHVRNELIETIKNKQAPAHEACADCPQICEEYYPEFPQSWSVNYFCQSVCNYKCSYCTVAHEARPDYDAGRHTLRKVLEACKGAKMLSNDYGVILSTAGEPLLHPNRKEFYDAFDGAELVINTNGSIYDPDLAQLMEESKVLLLISIDAGTSETYARIKGVGPHAFSAVKKNLREYAKASVGFVALKYLFVPGINDSLENIDGFIKTCEEIDVMFVIVSVDYFSMNNITTQTQNAILHLCKELSDRNILCVPYTAWETAEYSEIIKKLMG